MNFGSSKVSDKEIDFLIRKQTMIRKNERNVKDVYKLHKKALGSGAFGVVTKMYTLDQQAGESMQNYSKEEG